MAWAQLSVSPFYLSVWERGSASMFHIYSTGLVALALCSKRFSYIVLVVGVHAYMDFMAGTGGSVFGISSIYVLEAIFLVCAVFIWGFFLLTARSSSLDDTSLADPSSNAAPPNL